MRDPSGALQIGSLVATSYRIVFLPGGESPGPPTALMFSSIEEVEAL